MNPWFPLWSFFISKSLYLQKSTIDPFIEYCCHVRVSFSYFCLDILEKLQKEIFNTVVTLHTVYLEPMTHRQNVASLSLFNCRFSNARNWELVKFKRNHVCLYSQAGIRLCQLMALLFFAMLWLFLYKNWYRWPSQT